MDVNKNLTGAGFVIYFDNSKGILADKPKDLLYLCILGLNNKLDFPKGMIDFGEYPYDCAIRETFEETNLENDIHYTSNENEYKEFNNRLIMYIAEINSPEDMSKIIFKPNPHSGIKEHTDYFWYSIDECREDLLDYLVPVIEWANNELDFKLSR